MHGQRREGVGVVGVEEGREYTGPGPGQTTPHPPAGRRSAVLQSETAR